MKLLLIAPFCFALAACGANTAGIPCASLANCPTGDYCAEGVCLPGTAPDTDTGADAGAPWKDGFGFRLPEAGTPEHVAPDAGRPSDALAPPPDMRPPDTLPRPDTLRPPDTLPRPDTVPWPVTFDFPGASDAFHVVDNPFWFNAGDEVTGTHATTLPRATSLSETLPITQNSLATGDIISLGIYVNGVKVGSFTVGLGQSSVAVAASFPAGATGPSYTLAYVEENAVPSGGGSIELGTGSLTLSP